MLSARWAPALQGVFMVRYWGGVGQVTDDCIGNSPIDLFHWLSLLYSCKGHDMNMRLFLITMMVNINHFLFVMVRYVTHDYGNC